MQQNDAEARKSDLECITGLADQVGRLLKQCKTMPEDDHLAQVYSNIRGVLQQAVIPDPELSEELKGKDTNDMISHKTVPLPRSCSEAFEKARKLQRLRKQTTKDDSHPCNLYFYRSFAPPKNSTGKKRRDKVAILERTDAGGWEVVAEVWATDDKNEVPVEKALAIAIDKWIEIEKKLSKYDYLVGPGR